MLFERLAATPLDTSDPQLAHRARILAKRLRYCIESLRPLLPQHRAIRWYETAVHLQATIGDQRDLDQANRIVSGLDVAPDIVAFLRGVAMGRMHPRAV